jgi:hypothetical protein
MEEILKDLLVNWNLWVWEKETDLICWSDLLMDITTEEEMTRQVDYEYNQKEFSDTWYCCTVFSAMTMLSYLMNTRFTNSEIRQVALQMAKDWKLRLESWAYLSDAIDYVRKRWNTKNPTKTISSYRVPLRDKELLKIIKDKCLMMQFGYYTSTEIYKDTIENWDATLKNYPKWYGHRVCAWWLNCINNYYWVIKNRFWINYFDDLVTNWVIQPNWYIYLRN